MCNLYFFENKIIAVNIGKNTKLPARKCTKLYLHMNLPSFLGMCACESGFYMDQEGNCHALGSQVEGDCQTRGSQVSKGGDCQALGSQVS